jgi:3-oxoacyl-[acyl-carrier-protein] synthase III
MQGSPPKRKAKDNTLHNKSYRKGNVHNNISVEQLQILSKKYENDPQAQEDIRRLILHEENMNIMNPILERSGITEQRLVSKVGSQAFSSVAKHERGVKRKEERSEIEKMLNRIYQRTVSTKTLLERSKYFVK